jgi:hypothetical protein
LRDLSAKILAVQNVFTDRRAYVNALTYKIETTTTRPRASKASSTIWKSTNRKPVVEYPDGSKASYTFPQLEETYNDLKDATHQALSAELGEVIKPVSEPKARSTPM